MLNIQNLQVFAGEKEIIRDISLSFELGKNYVVLGKNGSGKSTLSSVLAWNPKYMVTKGEIDIESENLLDMTPEERSKKGVFLSFQNVPEIKWINLAEYLRTIYNNALAQKQPDVKPLSPFVFKRFIKKYLDELKIDESFLARDLNVGFSGWEKRKIEILQMKLLEPKYIILDEIDSGLDIDAFRTIAEILKSIDTPDNTIIVITHYFSILDYIAFDKVFVVENGTIKLQWGKEVVDMVKEKWFNS